MPPLLLLAFKDVCLSWKTKARFVPGCYRDLSPGSILITELRKKRQKKTKIAFTTEQHIVVIFS